MHVIENMHTLKLFSLALLICNCVNAPGPTQVRNNPTIATSASEQPPVVLELFTSQGCSSCPAAERVLNDLAANKNIITLSYHVDYWGRLGWKDTYSDPAYSRRQYEYASALSSGVYTPQLIINGEKEMVGSNRTGINEVIKNAAVQNDITLNIDSAIVRGRDVKVFYHAKGEYGDAKLNLVIIETQTSTEVLAGENRGEKLPGKNVVRYFKTNDNIDNNRPLQGILPADLSPGDASVVLLLQLADKKILAADLSALNGK